MDMASKVNSQPSSLDNWTKEDKLHLLEALKNYSNHEIDKIHAYQSLAHKTREEIQLAINHYKKRAVTHPKFAKTRTPATAPLASWINILEKNYTLEQLHTDTATAAQMVADLQEFPDPSQTEGIDLRKIYQTIGNALAGKPMPPVTEDAAIISVLHSCLKQTHTASKAFMKNSTLKNVISSIDLGDTSLPASSKPKETDDPEIGILRQLASKKNFNPLNLPDNVMQPSCVATSRKGTQKETARKQTVKKETAHKRTAPTATVTSEETLACSIKGTQKETARKETVKKETARKKTAPTATVTSEETLASSIKGTQKESARKETVKNKTARKKTAPTATVTSEETPAEGTPAEEK